jgi:1-acyl-sn-glycerol-3-phosphate acyltransferase
VFVSWLPLYHDLGLIAAWLGCLCFGTPTVIMTPQTFIARPESWLWAIHRHRATLSGGPNFAFDYCVHRIRPERLEGLDLGSLRVLFNGAEPISADTLARFHERFEPFGLRREVMRPVYGLAENSVGLTVPPPGRPPLVDRIDAQMLRQGGRAEPVADADVRVLEVVGCGQPLPGHEIRIVGSNGRELPDRHEGRVQFRGPSASSGYFRNPEETELLFDGDWLNSGDLGYLADGELFITGRDKDLIIRGGRNIHPVAIEKRVEELPGVRRGAVAVFGAPDPRIGTERLVIVAETRLYKLPEREQLSRSIHETVTRLLDLPPDDVVLVPPYTIPKTSSGKLRRRNTRQLYLSGAVARGRLAMWVQHWRIRGEAALEWLGRRRREVSALAYAAYAWALLCLLTPPTWALVVLAPGRWMRLAALRRAARLLTRLTGTPLRIEVAAPLPDGAAVLVANHTSYLDCLPLAAALPALPTFVAKRELAGNWFLGPFLRGIGTLFVTRRQGDSGAGIDEMHRVTARLAAGEQVLFFPEGTFTRQPGLLPFQLGAFVAAASAGCPVVPVTLTGTRAMLRLGRWRPSRGRLAVHVGEPIRPDGADWALAVRLRDAAREAILARCGEPDLAGATVFPGQPGSP